MWAYCFTVTPFGATSQASNPICSTVLLFRMLYAAFKSRSRTRPQLGQLCTLSANVLGTTIPHRLHCWVVPSGLTNTTLRPALSAFLKSLQLISYVVSTRFCVQRGKSCDLLNDKKKTIFFCTFAQEGFPCFPMLFARLLSNDYA